ncbi:nitroreductase family protein [Pseudooceanicola batsensis HTCC2597]|uniref:Nitroreductase family protein n=1 Tax=Pseudooceanicola batsensis (strain ATCC BAA-863 / DSM 15984 / KCTC 12145 / HTCC2597) TaxID=252305 RepID=A3TVT3_PSEBH|nr:nitroreductase family protein [Pseudooceanicola batsensis]EAQ03729.1 nitroreductase family protein [Pseudooceanicola batsensis HTCC2597]
MYSKDRIAYQPLPLPDRQEVTQAECLSGAQAFRDRMKTRHTLRDFSDRPVDREVIEAAIATAGLAPSGANHQPWHFVAISDPGLKARIRAAAEDEEARFYSGGASDAWLQALEPIGTGISKPHLEIAPWLIVIFAQRYGVNPDGERYKNYYVPESTGIATGFLIAALHHAGLYCLTHTPNPMRFLTEICGRPDHEKPLMILAVGHAAAGATVPAAAKRKKPLSEILTVNPEGR